MTQTLSSKPEGEKFILRGEAHAARRALQMIVMPKRNLESMPRFLFLLAAALLVHDPLRACSVPVFRYALEHWAADSYEALVLHRGALSPADASLLKSGEARHANLSVKTVDLDASPPAEMSALAKQIGVAEAPMLVLRQPRSARSAVAWSGGLTRENFDALLDSPARGDIATRIGAGDSAVWVLLECGDAAKDAAAAALLESRLAYLAGVLALPKLDEQDIRNGLVSLPDDGLHLQFSTLRIARDDAAESVFTSVLLATEPDLKTLRGEPMAFPVFGQGRVLYALVGAGIRHETIETAASFLIGSCSCQVKEQNPGMDVLMAVDWKALVKSQSEAPPDLPKLAGTNPALPVSVTTTTQAAAPPPEKKHPVWLLAVVYAFAPLVSGVMLVMLWNKRKRKAP